MPVIISFNVIILFLNYNVVVGVPQRREITWGIALSSPQERGNKKWSIVFSGNPKEKPVKPTIKVQRIWEAARHD